MNFSVQPNEAQKTALAGSQNAAFKSHSTATQRHGEIPPFFTRHFAGDRIYSVYGLSKGDEGKGKLGPDLVRVLTAMENAIQYVGMMVKVNGGANSGHTVHGLKHNLIPGGVREDKVLLLGIAAGVVADPLKLSWEVRALQAKGFCPLSKLRIDERVMVSDLSHRLLDLGYETFLSRRDGIGRGSTGRGISPAYSDETNLRQIYYESFADETEGFSAFKLALRNRVEINLKTLQHAYNLNARDWMTLLKDLSDREISAHKNEIERGVFSASEFDFAQFQGDAPFTLDIDKLATAYWDAGSQFAPHIIDIGEKTLEFILQKLPVIVEHGQSVWLDKRLGFSHNRTASHTTPAEIPHSLGIPTHIPIHSVGCCKAYDTAVGTHLFLTEMERENPLHSILSKLEFGTSTGRQRLVGWSDLVEKGTAIRKAGADSIAINKIDALSYGGEWREGMPLKVCVQYADKDSGRKYTLVPRNDRVRHNLEPVYIELPGWNEDLSGVRRFNDLPKNAQIYLAVHFAGMVTIASSGNLSLPVVPSLDFIGVGPDPDQTITDAPSPWELFNIARESGYLNDSVLPEISRVHASLRVSSLRPQTQP